MTRPYRTLGLLVETPRGNASGGVISTDGFLTTEKEGKNKSRRKGSAEKQNIDAWKEQNKEGRKKLEKENLKTGRKC
jgi:hypothetical protein